MVFLGLKQFLLDLRGHHVFVRMNNTLVVSCIHCRLCSSPLFKLAQQTLLWAKEQISCRGTMWTDPASTLSPTLEACCYHSSPTRDLEPVGPAPQWDWFIDSGLSMEVVETILNAGTSSTRKRNALRWCLITSWYDQRHLDPVRCPGRSVQE